MAADPVDTDMHCCVCHPDSHAIAIAHSCVCLPQVVEGKVVARAVAVVEVATA